MTSSAPPVRTRRSIALLGVFGIGNLGNDASLAAVLTAIRQRRPDAFCKVIATRAPVVTEAFGIPAVPCQLGRENPAGHSKGPRMAGRFADSMRSVRDFVRIMRQGRGFERLVIPGTGILDDYAMPGAGFAFTTYLWCLAMRLARRPVQLVSVGVGPIELPANRRWMKAVARLATTRSYRDTWSRDYAAGLGVDVSCDAVLPDIVFAHPLPGLEEPRASDRPAVGIGVMGWYGWWGDHRRGDSTYRGYLDHMAGCVTHCLSRGWQVRLLPGKVSDLEAAADLLAHLPSSLPRDRVTAAPIRSFDALLAEIGRTDLVVASRFHNIVAALLLQRPVVSIAYSPKNDALLNSLDLDAWSQSIQSIDPDLLLRQIDDAFANREGLAAGIGRRVARFRAQLDAAFDLLFPPDRPASAD